MKKVLAVAAALALLSLSIAAQAAITIDTVAVGNAHNAADTTTGYGSVGYNYNIGKYEVTAAQYTDFLNNKAKSDPYGLYNTSMGDPSVSWGCNIQRSGGGIVADPYVYTVADEWANRPVNYVSYWDSLRFANWLGNGQGIGDTETGAYTIPSGYNGDDGRIIQRNTGWTGWAVTSEDEWYKAAYYDPNKPKQGGGTQAGYWLSPTQSDAAPLRNMADASGNNANYYDNGYLIGSPYYRTNVGEFQNSDSFYGTFDQGGNVWEWNEAIVFQDSNRATRGLRGGSFIISDVYLLQASYRNSVYASYPSIETSDIGFRVSEVVPEPSSIIALAGGLISLLGIRRRRA
jgi:formylglycine-generating enzyme required for sulfatase activity